MTREPSRGDHCERCSRRLSKRQALVDWAPVAIKVIWEMLQNFWF
jgi:hypothetical protein